MTAQTCTLRKISKTFSLLLVTVRKDLGLIVSIIKIQKHEQLKGIILINRINFTGNFMLKLTLSTNYFPHHREDIQGIKEDTTVVC